MATVHPNIDICCHHVYKLRIYKSGNEKSCIFGKGKWNYYFIVYALMLCANVIDDNRKQVFFQKHVIMIYDAEYTVCLVHGPTKKGGIREAMY